MSIWPFSYWKRFSFKPGKHREPRMRSNRLIGVFLTLLTALMFREAHAQVPRRSQREQSRFGAEVAIRRPVEIPAEVLSILREDKRNQGCLREGESPTNIISSWFVGSRIHLNGDSKRDLVITAKNTCLLGANLGLDVLNTKTNNYRDIRTGTATARTVHTVIFKFDGKNFFYPSSRQCLYAFYVKAYSGLLN
jgi:hypothetical protein